MSLAYGLYVFPVLALLSLLCGTDIFSLWTLVPTGAVAMLLRFYMATSVTNRALRAFVFYGMGIGFLSGLILPVFLGIRALTDGDTMLLGIAAIMLIGALTGWSIWNASRMVVRHLPLSSRKIQKPVRLAFLSDVHIGSNPPAHLTAICDRLATMDYDALLIGGDLFDSSDFRIEDIAALKNVNQDIYFVTGNHEGYVGGYQDLLAQFADLNIRVLNNEATDLFGMNLIGVADEQPVPARARVADSLRREDRYNIALVHQPSIWRQTDRDADLMLCGHTHRGQIMPFNFLVRLQFRYVYGLFSQAGSTLYVSSGAGCWGPRMRLGSHNEIVMITLQPFSNSAQNAI